MVSHDYKCRITIDEEASLLKAARIMRRQFKTKYSELAIESDPANKSDWSPSSKR